jgi:tetratricopeptide (TPR) repeat protein
MTTEQWLDKAIIYFSGAMPAEEAALFEKETAASEELSQLMKLWRTTDKEAAIMEQHTTEAAAFIATHQKLKADFIEPVATPALNDGAQMVPVRKIKMPALQWIAVAAVLTGVIFMVELIISNNNKPGSSNSTNAGNTTNVTPKDTTANLANETKDTIKGSTAPQEDKVNYEKLYAQNFKPDEVPDDSGGPLENAFFYYESSQYKNAIEAIDNAKNATLTRGNSAFTPLSEFYALYYKALSMMSLGNISGAIPLLKNCMQQSPSDALKANTQWYLSLAYLHEQDITVAIQTLRTLINNPSGALYKTRAENILHALNK